MPQLIHSPAVRPARAFRALQLVAVLLSLSGCSALDRGSASIATLAPPTTVDGHTAAGLFRVEGELPDSLRPRVTDVLDRYLTNAVLVPLMTGGPAGGLDELFDGPARERLKGEDRAAIVDEGLPKATNIRVETASATVTSFSPSGGDALVLAGIRIKVTASLGASPLALERTGELTLAGDADGLRITGYELRVTRDTAAA